MKYLPNLFDDFFPTVRNSVMRTDIHENDGCYTLDVELPGFKKENISLELREFVEDSATCLFIAMVGSVVDSVLFLLLYFHFFNI